MVSAYALQMLVDKYNTLHVFCQDKYIQFFTYFHIPALKHGFTQENDFRNDVAISTVTNLTATVPLFFLTASALY